MSIDLVNLSYKQKNISSSEQSVLTRLAWHMGDNNCCWPSIKSISDDTKLDRKTVQQCLLSLESKYLIKKTGEMKGRTKSVPAYIVTISDPEIGIAQKTSDPVFSRSDPKNGTAKRSQKRDMERSYIKDKKDHAEIFSSLSNQEKQTVNWYLKNTEMPVIKEDKNLEEIINSVRMEFAL